MDGCDSEGRAAIQGFAGGGPRTNPRLDKTAWIAGRGWSGRGTVGSGSARISRSWRKSAGGESGFRRCRAAVGGFAESNNTNALARFLRRVCGRAHGFAGGGWRLPVAHLSKPGWRVTHPAGRAIRGPDHYATSNGFAAGGDGGSRAADAATGASDSTGTPSRLTTAASSSAHTGDSIASTSDASPEVVVAAPNNPGETSTGETRDRSTRYACALGSQ